MTVIAISGTGTDVGKTHVTCALVGHLRARSHMCAAVKPIESGGHSDSSALSAATGSPSNPPYQFQSAVSPHLAARQQGTTIDLEECARWIAQQAAQVNTLLVELAGGLLTPLSQRTTNADLVRLLACDHWVVVASDRLGVLHDLNALLMCCRFLGLAPPLVVLNTPLNPDSSTGTNAEELKGLGICQLAAQFPRASPDAQATSRAAHALAKALGLL